MLNWIWGTISTISTLTWILWAHNLEILYCSRLPLQTRTIYWSNIPFKLRSYKSCMHQPCHFMLVFLHLSNLGCRVPFASPSSPANTYFVTPSPLLGLLSVLRLTTIKSVMVLLTAHKHCRHHGFTSIIGYNSPIHQCLLFKTNYLHITDMVLSGFSKTYRYDLSSINHRL